MVTVINQPPGGRGVSLGLAIGILIVILVLLLFLLYVLPGIQKQPPANEGASVNVNIPYPSGGSSGGSNQGAPSQPPRY